MDRIDRMDKRDGINPIANRWSSDMGPIAN